MWVGEGGKRRRRRRRRKKLLMCFGGLVPFKVLPANAEGWILLGPPLIQLIWNRQLYSCATDFEASAADLKISRWSDLLQRSICFDLLHGTKIKTGVCSGLNNSAQQRQCEKVNWRQFNLPKRLSQTIFHGWLKRDQLDLLQREKKKNSALLKCANNIWHSEPLHVARKDQHLRTREQKINSFSVLLTSGSEDLDCFLSFQF